MSLIDTVRSWFSSGGSGTYRAAKRLYLVDGARILDEKAGGRLGPREQIQVLQQLSKFVAQEKVKMIAVFEGRPLREVENGGDFSGVTVHFAEQAGAVQDLILKLQRKNGSAVVVVTSDAQLEKSAAAQGGVTLRASTFRKALGSNGGGGGGGNGDRRRDQGGRRRHFRQRPQQQGPRPSSDRPSEESSAAESGTPGPAQPAADHGGGEKDAVRNLIDLVE